MNPKSKLGIVSLPSALLLLILLGCDQMAEKPSIMLPENQAPQIVGVNAESTAAQIGEEISMDCSATDPDLDLLSYEWSGASGQFLSQTLNDSTTLSTVQWMAPESAGNYLILVTVTDGSLSDYDTIQVTVNQPPPPAPSSLTALVISPTLVELSWQDNSTTEDGFIVERSGSSWGPFAVIDSTVADTTVYRDTGLTTSQTYYYHVLAYNAAGSSAASNVVSAWTEIMPADGLMGYYPLNGDAQDLSGNGLHGALHGAFPTSDRFGIPNQAYTFDGLGSYISLPTALWSSVDITLAAWIYWTDNSMSNQPILIGLGDDTGMLLTPKAAPHFRFSLQSGQLEEFLQTLPPLGISDWIFVAITLQGDAGTLYKNGVPVKAETITMNPSQMQITELGLGGSSSSVVGFSGTIDDVRIYSEALSPDEIQTLYHEGGW